MYKQIKLKNGLRVISVPMQGTKTVTVLIMVGTGSKYEDRRNSGISHFLEHMFFKGTEKRPNTLAISAELDRLGAEFNAFTGKEYTGYWIKVNSKKMDKALDAVSDLFLNSKIKQSEIDKEKGVIIEELNMYEDNPLYSIEDVFEQCLYGDTPAGRDTIGTKKNIMSFKRRDFRVYLDSQYGAHNTYLIAAGNIGNAAQFKQGIEKYFFCGKLSGRDNNFREKQTVKDFQDEPRIILKYKKTDQAHISLGVRAHSYDHRDALISKLISIILGGSMSSRLFINLREKQGLAYYVRTQNEVYSDSGYISTRAGVPKEKVEKAAAIILNEYKRMTKEFVKKEELDRAKDLIEGRSAIQFEASDNLANFYGRQAIMINTVKRTDPDYEEKIISPEEHLKKIRRINAEDIRRVAKEIFVNKHLNLAVIGPFKDERKFGKIVKL